MALVEDKKTGNVCSGKEKVEPSMLLSSDKIPRNISTIVILCLSLNILQTSILGQLQEFDK